MISMLVGLAVFFLVASLTQLIYIQHRIELAPPLDLRPALDMLKDTGVNSSERDRLDFARWQSLSILDGYALQRRYHQANVLLMSRIWTRYLGFITGMTLALVGAAYILGKLREPYIRMDAEGGAKFSIITTSPGLVLTVLGTLLMLTTLTIQYEIKVDDAPTYTQVWFGPSVMPPPPQFPNRGKSTSAPESPSPGLDEIKRRIAP
jgi:hypothetical protein